RRTSSGRHRKTRFTSCSFAPMASEMPSTSQRPGLVLPATAASVRRRYYAFQFFFNLLLWIPVFYEFQKQLGLDDPQIFRIQSVYYLVFCFLEIPTGAFADRFGYRRSLIWG